MKYKILCFFVAVVVSFTGCTVRQTSLARNVALKDSQPHVFVIKAEHGGFSSTAEAKFDLTVVSEISMESALALALEKNPSLSGFSDEIRARDAAALQAGLLPNPELEVEVENFNGNDTLQGFDGAEITTAFSQLIELGGKRGNRRTVAALDKTLAEWDYESKKLDVLAATAKAFVEVLIAQEQVVLNAELLKLAERTAAAVAERVDAGKVSPIEKTRVRIELAATRTEANKTKRELDAARRRLASSWGDESANFDRVVGRLDDLSALPTEASLRTSLNNNPDLARWATEIERAEADLSLVRSEAVPDLTLNAGIRSFQETDDNAFVVGISMPIPFFDRNQGSISEARARIDKVRSEYRTTKTGIITALSDTWQNISAAYMEAVSIRDDILPGAQTTYSSTEIGYQEGKLDFLQMLDAQRTLFTVKRQYLLSLGAYHLAGIELERITGDSMHNLNKNRFENKESQK